MDFPVDLLRTLAVVVDEGTLDRGAAALHVTPSAVSQRIRALESRVGRVLLARSKPVRPTTDGEALLRLARQVLLLEHEAARELGIGEAGAQPTRVRLGVNADSLETWFLPVLAAIAEREPVTFEVHREDQERTARLLESGEVMAAVTAQATPVAGCVATPLGSMRYQAVASRAFAARHLPAGGTPAELARAPHLDFDRHDDLQRAYLDARGVTALPPRHVISASAEFAKAVALGLGWGMLPPGQSAAGFADGSLVLLPGEPIDVPLHWQAWNLSSPVLETITRAVVEAAAASDDLV